MNNLDKLIIESYNEIEQIKKNKSVDQGAFTNAINSVFQEAYGGLIDQLVFPSTGSHNVFLGYQASQSNTTGTQNTFIGRNAGNLYTQPVILGIEHGITNTQD